MTSSIQTRWNKIQKSIDASVICDDWIDLLNKVSNTFDNAPKDVLDVMNAELIS